MKKAIKNTFMTLALVLVIGGINAQFSSATAAGLIPAAKCVGKSCL